MEDGFGEALLNRFKRDKRSANVRFNGHRQAVTGPPVIAEGYQDSDRTTGLGSQDGIVPDKVSDREAGTNRSGNTGRTRLLNMKGRWSFFLRYRKLLRNVPIM